MASSFAPSAHHSYSPLYRFDPQPRQPAPTLFGRSSSSYIHHADAYLLHGARPGSGTNV